MKRLTLIFLVATLAVTFCTSTVYAGGVMKKRVRYDGEELLIKLYNGRECETAKLVVQTRGTNRGCGFDIDVEWDDPSGHHREKYLGQAHPGDPKKYEKYICMKGDNPKPGTGVLRVLCGGDEVFFTEFACDGRYIRFGESNKPPSSVDVRQDVEINVPEKPHRDERPRGTSRSAVFNIKSTPSSADLYVDGNWVGNTPATIELPFGQHKIEVKKEGYKTWRKELRVAIKGEFNITAQLKKPTSKDLSEAEGKIVFTSERGGSLKQIYIMNTDGSDVKRLTNHDCISKVRHASNPLSPDGTRILYWVDHNIYIASATGEGKPVKLTDKGEDIFPCWSPDGRQIAFVSFRDGKGRVSNVYVMNADGSGLKKLTRHYEARGGNHVLYELVWSPDSKKIAFIFSKGGGGDDIYVVDANGRGQPTNLTRTADEGSSYDNFSWSPDGKKLLFYLNFVGKRSKEQGLIVMSPDGTGLRRIYNKSVDNPIWSPDSKKILFFGSLPGRFDEIYVIDADGVGKKNLTNLKSAHDRYPRWSPDGKKIVFVSTRDGNKEVYVMDSDGSDAKRLTNNPGEDTNPSWWAQM